MLIFYVIVLSGSFDFQVFFRATVIGSFIIKKFMNHVVSCLFNYVNIMTSVYNKLDHSACFNFIFIFFCFFIFIISKKLILNLILNFFQMIHPYYRAFGFGERWRHQKIYKNEGDPLILIRNKYNENETFQMCDARIVKILWFSLIYLIGIAYLHRENWENFL